MYPKYNKEELLDLVIMAFNLGNLNGVWLLVGYNELAKTFTSSNLRSVEEAVLVGVQKNPALYSNLISCNVYVRQWGASVFINKLPFSYIRKPATVIGGRMSYKTCIMDSSFPHLIDRDTVTANMQGWRLVNHVGRQNLPKLKRDYLKYAIITKPENMSFYQSQHPTSVVYTYPEFYHFRAFPFEK